MSTTRAWVALTTARRCGSVRTGRWAGLRVGQDRVGSLLSEALPVEAAGYTLILQWHGGLPLCGHTNSAGCRRPRFVDFGLLRPRQDFQVLVADTNTLGRE